METTNSSDPDLEAYRAYLVTLARTQLPQAIRTRLDASDIVQETLMEAHRKRSQFMGTGSASLAAWLRQLLTCNVVDAIRKEYRNKRDVRREQQVAASIEASAAGLAILGSSEQTSPSMRFERQQNEIEIASAMEQLPVAQRQAMIMRYCQNLSIAQIAEAMDKSVVAVAGLLKRGTATLRERLGAERDE